MADARTAKLAVSLLLSLLVPAALAGCGSSVDASTFADDSATADAGDSSAPAVEASSDAPLEEASATESGVDATVDTAPPPTPTTLDNVCARWSDAICATPTKDCCTRRSIGYDAAGCRNAVTGMCGSLVTQVKAAQRTFNAGQFDACAQAWRSLETTCSVPFVDYVKGYAPCAQMFPGTIGAGKACTDDNECIAPVGGVAFCDKGTKTCATALIVAGGAACSYDSAGLRLCDHGEYCPAQTGGKCKAVTPPGGSCSGPNDVACGLGFQCAQTSMGNYQCKLGLPASAQCTNGLQCASWTCNGLTPFGGMGTCSDPYAQMASPGICQGVP